MKTLPNHLTAYKRTPEFNEFNIPKGLLHAHQTKKNVWGKIIVIEGNLQYRIYHAEKETIILTPELNGIVEPETVHDVKALEHVRFYVEFYQ